MEAVPEAHSRDRSTRCHSPRKVIFKGILNKKRNGVQDEFLPRCLEAKIVL